MYSDFVCVVTLACIMALYTCKAMTCYMGQQPDPKQGYELRWVLPYTKDELCECTYILFGGLNLEAPVGAEDHFYADNPMIFINNDNLEELRGLLGCDGAEPTSREGSNGDPTYVTSGEDDTTVVTIDGEEPTSRKGSTGDPTSVTMKQVDTTSVTTDSEEPTSRERSNGDLTSVTSGEDDTTAVTTDSEEPTSRQGSTGDPASVTSGEDDTTAVTTDSEEPTSRKGSNGDPTSVTMKQVDTTSVTTDSEECFDPLGMEDRSIIPYDNIQASSYHNTWLASYARLNGNRAWCASFSDDAPWIQANIGYQTTVTGVVSQGQDRGGGHNWVTTLKVFTFLSSTSDPEIFITEDTGEEYKVFSANTDSDTEVTLQFELVTARIVRIYPLTKSGNYYCMRFELLGCKIV